jgi:hypothetical protein
VLEFARRIERIDVNLHGARPDDAEKGYRDWQQVGSMMATRSPFFTPSFF